MSSHEVVTFRDFLGNLSPGEESGTAFLFRGLSVFYGHRWRIGFERVVQNGSSGLSDFTVGNVGATHERELDELHLDQLAAQERLFSHPLYERSLLGECRREIGDTAAHTLALLFLGELEQIGKGYMSVREIAWSLSPKYFHRYLATAHDAARQLHEHSWAEVVGGGEVTHVSQSIVPTSQALQEFLNYLAHEDPIRDHEAQDLLKSLC